MFICIMLEGKPLSDIAAEILMQKASLMFKKENHKASVYCDDVAGEITTNFDSAILGGMTGVVFKAKVDTPKGHTQVEYLLDVERYDPSQSVRHIKLKTNKQKRSPSDAYRWN